MKIFIIEKVKILNSKFFVFIFVNAENIFNFNFCTQPEINIVAENTVIADSYNIAGSTGIFCNDAIIGDQFGLYATKNLFTCGIQLVQTRN